LLTIGLNAAICFSGFGLPFPKEATVMKDFVHEQNIRNYRKRLERQSLGTTGDEAPRKMVPTLLVEEERKDLKFSPPAG